MINWKMTRIEKVISELSDLYEFYEKIKEHKREKAAPGRRTASKRENVFRPGMQADDRKG